MTQPVNANDLDAKTRKKLGIVLPRKSDFSKDLARRHAIRCLAVLAELTQRQRARVLAIAAKINKV